MRFHVFHYIFLSVGCFFCPSAYRTDKCWSYRLTHTILFLFCKYTLKSYYTFLVMLFGFDSLKCALRNKGKKKTELIAPKLKTLQCSSGATFRKKLLSNACPIHAIT